MAPHRLGEALLRLVDAGIDLELSPSVTPANALTTLLMRVNAVLAGGFDLLPLRTIDLIPTVSSPTPDNLTTQWPSLVTFGDLVQPADGSLLMAASPQPPTSLVCAAFAFTFLIVKTQPHSTSSLRRPWWHRC